VYVESYACVLCGVREHKKQELVDNQRKLQNLLRLMRANG
jgi:hypothetical protein